MKQEGRLLIATTGLVQYSTIAGYCENGIPVKSLPERLFEQAKFVKASAPHIRQR